MFLTFMRKWWHWSTFSKSLGYLRYEWYGNNISWRNWSGLTFKLSGYFSLLVNLGHWPTFPSSIKHHILSLSTFGSSIFTKITSIIPSSFYTDNLVILFSINNVMTVVCKVYQPICFIYPLETKMINFIGFLTTF